MCGVRRTDFGSYAIQAARYQKKNSRMVFGTDFTDGIEPDGRIMEGRYVNGKRHGYWMERTKDKRLLWEAEYVDGKEKWERSESE